MKILKFAAAAIILQSFSLAQAKTITFLECGSDLGPALEINLNNVEVDGIVIKSFGQASIGLTTLMFELPNNKTQYDRIAFVRKIPVTLSLAPGGALNIYADTNDFVVMARANIAPLGNFGRLTIAFSGTVTQKSNGTRFDISRPPFLCRSNIAQRREDVLNTLRFSGVR